MPQTPKRKSPSIPPRESPARQDGTPPTTAAERRERKRRAKELHGRLAQEETALARWMTRLKRAFRAVQKHTRCIARVRRQLPQVEP